MLEFLKVAAVVVVSSVASSAILAKLLVVFGRRIQPPSRQTNHAHEA